jgi:hypothetical protein
MGQRRQEFGVVEGFFMVVGFRVVERAERRQEFGVVEGFLMVVGFRVVERAERRQEGQKERACRGQTVELVV